MVKRLKKFIPVLCCFVILASFIVPASAAVTYTYSIWLDDFEIISYPAEATSIGLTIVVNSDGCKVSVDGAGEEYSYHDKVASGYVGQFAGLSNNGSIDSVNYYPGNVYAVTLTSSNSRFDLNSVFKYPLYIDPNGGVWNGSSDTSVFWEFPNTDTDEIYDPTRSGYTFTGWTFSGAGEFNDFGYPPFNYEHAQGAGYLTANWEVDSSVSSYSTIVHIGSNSYTFTAQGSSPNVTLTDLGTSLQLSDGVSTFSYAYPADLTFEGFSFSPDGAPFLSPGGSYVIQGASASNSIFTIYPLFSSDASDSHYSLTINIFNSTGTTLYRTFSASSVSSPLSPTATMYPIAAGLSVDVGDGARWTWLEAESGFIGFSDKPYSSTAVYAAGGTYYVGGDAHDTIINLYVVYDHGVSNPADVDFVSWLATAVGGFLDFQLWPGLSLNDLLWVILVMGILFAFLKLTV